MATYRFTDRYLLLDTEPSYGTDANPVAADAVVFIDGSARDETENLERKLDKQHMSGAERITGRQRTVISGNVEFMPSGQAGVEPALGRLLKACGHAVTIDATPGSETVTYNPVSDNWDSVSCTYKHGPALRRVLGARGSIDMDLSIDAFAAGSVTLTGIYSKPVAPGVLVPDYSAFVQPKAITELNWTTTLGGIAVPIKQITLSRAPEINDHAGSNNYREIAAGDHDPTGTIKIYADTLATIDPYLWRDNKPDLVLSSEIDFGGQYNIFEFGASRVRVLDVQEVNENSRLCWELSVQYLPTDSGADDYFFRFK